MARQSGSVTFVKNTIKLFKAKYSLGLFHWCGAWLLHFTAKMSLHWQKYSATYFKIVLSLQFGLFKSSRTTRNISIKPIQKMNCDFLSPIFDLTLLGFDIDYTWIAWYFKYLGPISYTQQLPFQIEMCLLQDVRVRDKTLSNHNPLSSVKSVVTAKSYRLRSR